jgi:hypothetical protein
MRDKLASVITLLAAAAVVVGVGVGTVATDHQTHVGASGTTSLQTNGSGEGPND